MEIYRAIIEFNRASTEGYKELPDSYRMRLVSLRWLWEDAYHIARKYNTRGYTITFRKTSTNEIIAVYHSDKSI